MSDGADRRHTPLGAGGEFDLVRDWLRAWGAQAQGVGDDAALLTVPSGSQLVVSTDSAVDDVHFRRDWLTPREIGWRAATAALSDLAAMGATPIGVVWALVLPIGLRDDAAELGAGVGAAASAVGCPIVGGDTTQGATLTLTFTVLGHTSRPLTRGGAQPGDAIWVTGALGGPGRALAAWLDGHAPSPADRERFAHPHARVETAQRAAAAGATAAIDISDGFAQDLGHLALASGLTARVVLERLPCVGEAQPTVAARSGEEYELILTAPAEVDLAAACGPAVPLTRVGELLPGAPGVSLEFGGRIVEVGPGHDHFSPL